jgi:excisionase family DNA binding protein
MAKGETELLTTGEVARMSGVTRDAVLKWIKKGRLQAVRTPGGHYRIPKEALAELPLEVFTPELSQASGAAETEGSEPVRCWEYFGDDGSPREACESCLVYLARAQNCYRLAELGEASGHRLHFCRHDCRTCSFYRACQGLAMEVLVITKDESMIRRLELRADPEKVSIRFARSGYEGSAVISTFSPALVLLDSELPEVRDRMLVESIGNDERIPGAQVVVGCRKGDRAAFEGLDVLIVPAPFSAGEVEELAQGVARAVGRLPEEVA